MALVMTRAAIAKDLPGKPIYTWVIKRSFVPSYHHPPTFDLRWTQGRITSQWRAWGKAARDSFGCRALVERCLRLRVSTIRFCSRSIRQFASSFSKMAGCESS